MLSSDAQTLTFHPKLDQHIRNQAKSIGNQSKICPCTLLSAPWLSRYFLTPLGAPLNRVGGDGLQIKSSQFTAQGGGWSERAKSSQKLRQNLGFASILTHSIVRVPKPLKSRGKRTRAYRKNKKLTKTRFLSQFLASKRKIWFGTFFLSKVNVPHY